MLLKGKYKDGLKERLGFIPDYINNSYIGRPVWIHAVSVGEVMGTLPLIKKLKKEYPDIKIILSTVTSTGNYVASSRIKEADYIIYLPFDLTIIVKRVINIINPRLFIIFESEIWPNLLRCMGSKNIPIIILNGRISNRSYKKYMLFKRFFKKVLNNISFFCMQSHGDLKRIVGIGANENRVIVTGNIKYDQVEEEIRGNDINRLKDSLGIDNNKIIFIAGSTHKDEEKIVIDVFNELRENYNNLLLILAPRHPERVKEVISIIERYGYKYIKRSDMLKGSRKENNVDIIVIDTVGELGKIYSIGDIIYVGGSLVDFGGHNILEPAIYKKPVIFGPYMQNFEEISNNMKENFGGIEVKNRNDFTREVKRLLNNKDLRDKLGELAYKVIEKNRGVTERNMEVIRNYL
jgi:3-deoxy-D-manno-octulosonic-acid transferase